MLTGVAGGPAGPAAFGKMILGIDAIIGKLVREPRVRFLREKWRQSAVWTALEQVLVFAVGFQRPGVA